VKKENTHLIYARGLYLFLAINNPHQFMDRKEIQYSI